MRQFVTRVCLETYLGRVQVVLKATDPNELRIFNFVTTIFITVGTVNFLYVMLLFVGTLH